MFVWLLGFPKCSLFSRDRLLTDLLHQDWLYRWEVILVGTCFCNELRHLDLKAVQSWLTGELILWISVNSVEKSARSFFMSLRSACFHRWIRRRTGFCLGGMIFESRRMASWSLKPGMLIHLFTSVGRLVMMTSSMLSFESVSWQFAPRRHHGWRRWMPSSWLLGCYDLWWRRIPIYIW